MTFSALDREQKAFEAVPVSARAVRLFVAETLRSHGASPQLVRDYALVVSELATNIIEHGDGSSLMISLDIADPEWWEVEVVGGASTPPDRLLRPDSWTVADAEQISGRGLGIVRHLMHEVSAGCNDGQISIRCRRRRAESE